MKFQDLKHNLKKCCFLGIVKSTVNVLRLDIRFCHLSASLYSNVTSLAGGFLVPHPTAYTICELDDDYWFICVGWSGTKMLFAHDNGGYEIVLISVAFDYSI